MFTKTYWVVPHHDEKPIWESKLNGKAPIARAQFDGPIALSVEIVKSADRVTTKLISESIEDKHRSKNFKFKFVDVIPSHDRWD